MTMGRAIVAAVLALALLGCRGEPPTAGEIAAARDSRPALDRIPLQIRSDGNTHDFSTEYHGFCYV